MWNRYDDEDEDDECEGKDKKDKKDSPAIAEKLYKSRTIIISGGIDMKLAKEVMAQLLALASDSDDDITLFLNSPGGHVEAGDTIHDMINFVKPRVKIVGTGWVASAGAHIFLSVPKKDRFALPNTRFLLHQPSGGSGGWATDIEIEADEILKMRKRLNVIIAKQTGQKLAKVEKDTDRNFWLTVEEAAAYGILGTVVKNSGDLEKL
ncbi:MAG: ATP-dependent Clp protease proteolytic subunit [Lentisphaeria bacterium]|nr:ATP-dependent Clp protease proteolytic subunit [Lentisphaeria bacterium]NQZ68782.1 ATP-dependent Clp protease proteolytic subunit [Lentisphaeria bacterium]